MTTRALVVGAGLAGLVAAVELVERGASVTLVERAPIVGGASRVSAGWIWRYRDLAGYRSGAPDGDPELQRLVLEAFDDAIAWLEGHGVEVLERGTGRTFTTGVRIDPGAALDILVGQLPADTVHLETSLTSLGRRDGRWHATFASASLIEVVPVSYDTVVLTGGGYAADIARVAREAGATGSAPEHWVVRPEHGGNGSTLDVAMQLGAQRGTVDGECFTRLVPQADAAARDQLLIPFGELGALDDQRLLTGSGEAIDRAGHDWSGAMQAWELARRGGAGWIELGPKALAATVHAGAVSEIVAQAERLQLDVCRSTSDDGSPIVRMPVVAGLTHTRCGLLVDAHAEVRGIPGLFAAGADVADIGRGGTAGGLAQALVLGRVAARGAIRVMSATNAG